MAEFPQRFCLLCLLVILASEFNNYSATDAAKFTEMENESAKLSKLIHVTESIERRLKRRLFHNYDRTSRPVLSDNKAVNVSVAVTLFQLVDVNEKEQTVRAVYSVRLTWTDEYLAWNNSEYKIDNFHTPASDLWQPDIVILNIASEGYYSLIDRAIVSYNGTVLWMWLSLSITTCSIDVRLFPFDEQQCQLVLLSWTHSGHKLNLTHDHLQKNAVYYSPNNQEWIVRNIDPEDHVKYYPCCPGEPYPDVTFTLHMHRRSLFYVMNLIIPGFLIYFLAALGFLLSSAEKVTFQATVLLTLMVFLFSVSDRMPPTPDSIPVISLFFLLILILVSLALSMSILVSTLFNRTVSQPIPVWTHRFVKMLTGQAMVSACDDKFELAGSRRTSLDRSQKSKSVSAEACDNLRQWKLLAFALDRFFLYLFLSLSTAAVLFCLLFTIHATFDQYHET